MEIDERLHLGCHKLIADEDDENCDYCHERQWHLGKADAIATLEACGKPMDDHAKHKEYEDTAIGRDDIEDIDIPLSAYAVDHVFGNTPRRFVGNGRVEVGSRTEKKSGEGDEGKSDQNRPSTIEPGQWILATGEIIDITNPCTCCDEEHEEEQKIP